MGINVSVKLCCMSVPKSDCMSVPMDSRDMSYSYESPVETQERYKNNKMNVKLLFLDVDGVLNNKFTQWNDHTNGMDDKLLKYLKLIIIMTQCKIVLSTTWRLNTKAKLILLHNIKTRLDININDIIIGQTKDLKYLQKNRADEIADYIATNAGHKFNIISWCAIDDMALDKLNERLMNGHFVKTNKNTGITAPNAFSVIHILNANDSLKI